MTPTPSDALPTAPARRWRPAERQQPTTPAPPPGRRFIEAGAFFILTMTITSHHNAKLKEIRKLNQRRRWRERSGRFVAEGEDLLAAADAAGWTAVERYCAAGSGLAGHRGRAIVAGRRPRGSARARGRSPSTRSAGRRPPPARCASTCTGCRIPATSALCCAARRRSAPRRSRSARGPPIRSAPRRCAPAWGPCSAWRSRA